MTTRYIVLGIALLIGFASLVFSQPAPCSATTGSGIVDCVAARYPERLVANIPLSQRQANAEFLRDRIIETARCAKLDVGLNCKRGNCNSISVDFVAIKLNGRTEGVDIAAAWDDTSRPLRLMWHTYGPPDYGFPTYKAYGPVSCLSDPPPPVDPPPVNPPVDLQPILDRLGALEAFSADINARLLTLLDSLNALVMKHDLLAQDIETLKSKPIPTVCAARGPLGIPIRCELR